MALIRIRHAHCDIGDACPALTVDTDTRDPETGTCGAIISVLSISSPPRPWGYPSGR